jgi:hypothetical protein
VAGEITTQPKTRQAGRANEQSMFSLMPMECFHQLNIFAVTRNQWQNLLSKGKLFQRPITDKAGALYDNRKVYYILTNALA